MITSYIKSINGNPSLFINGEPVSQNAYMTYFLKKGRYADFADAGYRLFSLPLFFATRSITEINRIPPFDDGIFEGREPDFSIVDRAFEGVLKVCPDAYVFPRVNMSIPEWWERENPDELCEHGNLDMNRRRACFGSDKWAEETKRMLGLLIDHIEHSHYRDRVCGYQLACGNTEEWFSFDFRGSVSPRSREKFREYCKQNSLAGTEVEYYSYLSRLVADRICEFSQFAKEKTEQRLIIGAFYGYTFECAHRESNHHALNVVLKSDCVDFLCSPISYMDYRPTGQDHPCMLPLESLKLHGKLYFLESDARTHLSGPLFDVPHFNNPNYKPREFSHSVESLKMYFARSFIKSHAIWWFDMGGGWYDYPVYMRLMADFLKIDADSKGKDMSSVAEVAVIVDERALSHFDPQQMKEISKPICNRTRYQLGLMGAPYDAYLADDYETVKDRYRAFIVLAPIMTSDIEKVLKDNPNCLVITTENKDISTSELRDYLRSRGVHIYSERDAVIYANHSYLFLHTASHGRADIKMPQGKMLKQIYGDPIDTEKTVLPGKVSFLFEVVDG